MGIDTSFKYRVEGTNVRLVRYTGRSNKVIIPKFITSLESYAFYLQGIEEVKINEGLEYIGNGAFESNKLSQVQLPSTVKFIGKEVFRANSLLMDNRNEYKKEAFKFTNTKAIVFDEYARKTLGIKHNI